MRPKSSNRQKKDSKPYKKRAKFKFKLKFSCMLCCVLLWLLFCTLFVLGVVKTGEIGTEKEKHLDKHKRFVNFDDRSSDDTRNNNSKDSTFRSWMAQEEKTVEHMLLQYLSGSIQRMYARLIESIWWLLSAQPHTQTILDEVLV